MAIKRSMTRPYRSGPFEPASASGQPGYWLEPQTLGIAPGRLNKPLNQLELLDLWRREEQEPFSGWDFRHLNGRHWTDDPKTWSYMDHASELLRQSKSAVDLDTGGGEQLLELRPHWPTKLYATESYPPNVKLATERLALYGVKVFDVATTYDGLMPFADGEFDLVLNRHGSFNPAEVGRVLAPGGTFFTQQVHARTNWDLQAVFGAKTPWPDAKPEYYVPRLESAGLTIVHVKESIGRHGFTDVGALIFYLKVIPWTVPGFSVDTHQQALLSLHQRLEGGQPLAFEWRSYVIEARKS